MWRFPLPGLLANLKSILRAMSHARHKAAAAHCALFARTVLTLSITASKMAQFIICRFCLRDYFKSRETAFSTVFEYKKLRC